MVTLPDINVGPLVFPSDLATRQQGHFMKIQIEPSKASSSSRKQTIFLFIPGGNSNGGPLTWTAAHEYDDVKLTKLGVGVVGAMTRMFPGGEAIAAAAEKISSAALTGARLAGYGTINPKVDVLYGNTELRRFTFTFFLAPQSEKESNTAKEIVKQLRKYSSPEISAVPPGLPGFVNSALEFGGAFQSPSGQASQLQSGLWFIPPAEFIITFHSITNSSTTGFNAPENPYLPKIGRCVLERIDVDVAQQGEFSTFENGAPTNMQLTMVFREMRVISQYDIDSGY